MVGLTLVQADLRPAPNVGIHDPVDHEKGSLDAADLTQGDGELVLAWIGRQLPQDLAGGDGSRRDGGGDAQNIWLVALNERLIDFAADRRPQMSRGSGGIEGIEPLR